MDILKKLQKEFQINAEQVKNTVDLLDEGNTVPFIARYRKEMTGSLDDQIIRQLADRLSTLRNLEEKKRNGTKSHHRTRGYDKIHFRKIEQSRNTNRN